MSQTIKPPQADKGPQADKAPQADTTSQTVKKLLYIITQAPYSNSDGQEALDAILIGASFEQQVSVLFLHDGVFQIKSPQPDAESPQLNKQSPQLNKQSPQRDGDHPQLEEVRLERLKDYTKTYSALFDFGVDACYVLASSLGSRGLQLNELSIQASVLDDAGVADLIQRQFRVFTF